LFFYAFETWIAPELNSANGVMPGAYRADIWVEGQDKVRFSKSKNYRDNIDVYVSRDQMFYKKQQSGGFAQGLGVFGRFGYASAGYTENHENALEVYYNAQVTPWLSINPISSK